MERLLVAAAGQLGVTKVPVALRVSSSIYQRDCIESCDGSGAETCQVLSVSVAGGGCNDLNDDDNLAVVSAPMDPNPGPLQVDSRVDARFPEWRSPQKSELLPGVSTVDCPKHEPALFAPWL